MFLSNPEQNLIFTYGKNDPLKRELLEKVAGKESIIALESPTDTELLSLIRWAIATIYIPVDEDFGMSPVESMACGIPVIGVDEWGLKETIIDRKTGRLIGSEQLLVELKKAIQETPKEEWQSMEAACIKRAQDFSLEKFQEKLQSLIYSP